MDETGIAFLFSSGSDRYRSSWEQPVTRRSSALITVCALILASCGGDSSSPTAPSSSSVTRTLTDEASLNVTLASRSVDARFEDDFWRKFVYNQHDFPDTIDERVSWVLNTKSPNLYIRMGDPSGRHVVSIQRRDHMRKTFPNLVQQMTGEPYRGRIEDGISDREQSGWITVRFVTYEEEPAIPEGACGRANVGASTGSIWIIRRAQENKVCVDDKYFPRIFAHEVGHALGFYHVPDPETVMTPGWNNLRETFSSREQYHGQLAYEVGRGAPYIGWPLPLLAAGFDQRRLSTSPIFIID